MMSVLDTIRESLAKWLLEGLTSKAASLNVLGSVKAVEEDPLRRVQLARVYWGRKQVVALTKRQEEWMNRHANGIGVRYVVNASRIVEEAYKERLHLESVGVSGKNERQNQEAERLLAAHFLPKHLQQELWEALLVDGVAFLFTDYTPQEDGGEVDGRVERLFVPEDLGGDGEGIIPIFYGGSNYPQAFAKIWHDEIPDPRTEGRTTVTATFKTVYETGLISRYVKLPGNLAEEEWQPYPDAKHYQTFWVWYPNGEPEPIPEGSDAVPQPLDFVPLPPPISAWALPGMRGVLDDVVPLQAMMDKVWVNMMMASDFLGSGIVTFIGWIPTLDGKPLKEDRSNLLMPVAGDYLYTAKDPSKARVDVTFPTSIDGLLALESRIIARLSAVSGVPQSAFVDSRQVAAEGTLKQQESALLARLQGIQAALSSGVQHWAEGLLAQIVAFGNESNVLEDWRGLTFTPIWKDTQTRNEKEQAELAKTMLEALGFDLVAVWKAMGKTQDEIDRLLESPFAQALIAEAKARIAAAEEQIQLWSG